MELVNIHAPHGDVWVFFAVFAVVLVGPWLAETARIPGIIGLLIGGFVVGPHALGIVEATDQTIPALGQLGLLYLMFLAGLELDLDILSQNRRAVVLLSAASFALPMLCGFVSGVALGYQVAAALLLGSLMASHTLLTYPLLRSYGLASNRAVSTTVGATVVTDTLALIVLAGVAGSAKGDAPVPELVVQLAMGLALLAAFCAYVLPRIVRLAFIQLGHESSVRYVTVLVALLAAGTIAEMVGIEAIVGAFFAGIALNRLVPNEGPLFHRIEYFGSTLLIPLFLVSVGLIIDPSVMAKAETLGLALVFILAVVTGKLAASALCRPMFGYSWAEVGVVFSLSIAQAAATLAATFVGFQVGLIGSSVVNAVLIVILVSVLIASFCAVGFGRRIPSSSVVAGTPHLGDNVVLGLRDDADTKAVLRLAALIARARGGLVRPVSITVNGGEPIGPKERERIEREAAAHGLDTEVLVRCDDSFDDALVHAARGEAASLVVAVYPREDLVIERLAPLVGRIDTPLICAAAGTRADRFVFVGHGGVGEVRAAADLDAALRRGGGETIVLLPSDWRDHGDAPVFAGRVETTDDPAGWLRSSARPDDLVLLPYGALARSRAVLDERPDVGAAVIIAAALEQTTLGDLR